MEWFYSKAAQQTGPVSQEELERLIQTGILDHNTLVWQQDFGDAWKPISQVQELAEHLPEHSAPQTSVPVLPAQVPPNQENVKQILPIDEFPRGAEFTRRAREALSGRWGISIGAYVIFTLILFVAGQIPFGSLVLSGPFMVGISLFFLKVIRKARPELDQLFSGFSIFGNAFLAYFLSGVFILLWSLLLIVPGIIAMFSYAQVYNLLADHPELPPMEAIRSSKMLMQGYKWRLFCLRLRFLGWSILAAIFTLGIGFLWLLPYAMAAEAAFYQELRARKG